MLLNRAATPAAGSPERTCSPLAVPDDLGSYALHHGMNRGGQERHQPLRLQYVGSLDAYPLPSVEDLSS